MWLYNKVASSCPLPSIANPKPHLCLVRFQCLKEFGDYSVLSSLPDPTEECQVDHRNYQTASGIFQNLANYVNM